MVGIVAEALQGRFLESVQLMRCAVLEGKIGNKAIVDVPLLFADDLAKFERQCCGNGYRARDGLIIVYYLGSTRMGQNPSDDIGGIIGRTLLMTELRSLACLLSAASARFVRSIHTATGSAASNTAIRSPVSTEH